MNRVTVMGVYNFKLNFIAHEKLSKEHRVNICFLIIIRNIKKFLVYDKYFLNLKIEIGN